MKIETMTAMATTGEYVDPNGMINPFSQDVYHMGTRLGTNVIIMHSNFDHDPARYLIVVDCKTGERIKIEF